MAFWPFRKRARRETKQDSTVESEPSQFPSSQAGPVLARKLSKQGRRRKSPPSREHSYGEVRQLEAIRPLSPMDSTFVRPASSESQGSVEDITALPRTRQLRTSPHLRPATRNDADIPYDFQLYTRSRIQTPNHQAMEGRPESRTRNRLSRSPSRRRPNPVGNLPIKLSKKPRNNGKDVREEDFRVMSAPTTMPHRPGRTDSGILRRDSKKMREGLNRNFERPMSNISLPRPDSRPSTTRSSALDGRAYRISVLDVLSPRPIVRAQEPPYSMLTIGWSAPPSRSNSYRRTISSGKQPYRSSNLKRVEDLADDMDSTDIREVMDRDRRRKEKKKERDTERLKRRLERRAEKERQREDDGAGAEENRYDDWDQPKTEKADSSTKQEGASSKRSRRSRSRKRDKARATQPVLEAAVASLSTTTDKTQHHHDSASAAKMNHHTSPSAPLRAPPGPPVMGDVGETAPPPATREQLEAAAGADPFLDPNPGNNDHDVQSIPQFPIFATSGSDVDESPLPSPLSSSYPLKNALGAHLSPSGQQTQPLSISATPSVTALPPVPSSPERKKRRTSLLLSFFRRGDKNKARTRSSSETDRPAQQESGPSFMNITRKQMLRDLGSVSAQPAIAQSSFTNPLGRDAPTRSQSKFHENLPEVTIPRLSAQRPPSPPSSRVNSPTAQSNPISPEYNRGAMVTPISHHRISEQSAYGQELHDPEAEGGNKSPVRQSNPFTQSLASIDSEGSWLTGKPVKRVLSNRSAAVRSNASTREPVSQRNSNSHAESRQSSSDDGTATPHQEEHIDERTDIRSSVDPKPSSVGGQKSSSGVTTLLSPHSGGVEVKKEGQMKVHGHFAKQPDIQAGIRVKSSEGLLKEMLKADANKDNGDYELDSEDDNPAVKRLDVRHDSTMPNIEDLSLELDSEDSDAPALRRATSVTTGKLLEADPKVIRVSKRSSREPISGTQTPRIA
jgi:hypothetical protein